MAASPGPPRLVRAALIVVGTVSLGLAVIGLVVPVLPATPFVLLAAACFARASVRLHAWLLSSRFFGPTIAQWQASRSVTRRVKWTAIPTMALTVGASALLVVEETVLRLALVGVGLAVGLFLLRLPTRG